MTTVLEVCWRNEAIGHLSCSGYYTFRYLNPLPEGFYGLPEFPINTETFCSNHLFVTFSTRLPQGKRRQSSLYRALCTSHGVTDIGDDLEILWRTGGRSLTDNLHFRLSDRLPSKIIYPAGIAVSSV